MFYYDGEARGVVKAKSGGGGATQHMPGEARQSGAPAAARLTAVLRAGALGALPANLALVALGADRQHVLTLDLDAHRFDRRLARAGLCSWVRS